MWKGRCVIAVDFAVNCEYSASRAFIMLLFFVEKGRSMKLNEAHRSSTKLNQIAVKQQEYS